MFLLRLLFKNAFRHRLRTVLTMVGLVVAICAFGLLRTIVDAWYAGVEGTSSTRLITRNSISLTFPLPLSYADRLRSVEGVTGVSWSNWFGGVYITERNFFPQFAVDAPSYLALYPEYVLKDDEKKAFLLDRQGVIVGRKLADTYGWKVGDQIALRGTIVLQEGSSTILRGQLARRGFQIVQTDVSQLFGPGGGGPRMLANELSGMVLSDDAPSYSSRRDELQQLLATYHR